MGLLSKDLLNKVTMIGTFVAPAPRRIYAEYVLDDASFVHASTNISEPCVPGTVLGRQRLRELTS